MSLSLRLQFILSAKSVNSKCFMSLLNFFFNIFTKFVIIHLLQLLFFCIIVVLFNRSITITQNGWQKSEEIYKLNKIRISVILKRRNIFSARDRWVFTVFMEIWSSSATSLYFLSSRIILTKTLYSCSGNFFNSASNWFLFGNSSSSS